jgi:hypothetical protein
VSQPLCLQVAYEVPPPPPPPPAWAPKCKTLNLRASVWAQREKECESGAWTDQKRVTERMVAVDWNQIMESASMKRLLLSDGPSVGYVFRRNAAVIYALFQYYAVVGGQVREPHTHACGTR